MRTKKIFAGAKLRRLRDRHSLTQGQLAARLDVSTSYINQIENNQRPLTAALMLALAQKFNLDLGELMSDKTDRLLIDLQEALADPVFGDTMPPLMELKTMTANSPDMAHALLKVYAAYKKSNERLAGADEAMNSGPGGGMQTPYEEVRDFFHYANNYIDPLDRAAEELAQELAHELSDTNDGRLHTLIKYLQHTHDINISQTENGDTALRRFDRASRTLYLGPRLNSASRYFQIAHQIALLEQTTQMVELLDKANFKTDEARQVCRIGLANYFAGALHMPYRRFLDTAQSLAYDLDELARTFGASLEQVAHRLSTMQREGARGVPFFFARVDAAGTITKRHSATPLQFARFGGACPLWNVHRAFETSGRIVRQFAQTPDGVRYLCLAWSSEKRDGGFGAPTRTYAYALGCEIAHADKLVYAADLDVGDKKSFDPIGISCRNCERRNCIQRSVPPIAAPISVHPDERNIVPYRIG